VIGTIYFTVDKPAWWRRNVVTLHMGDHSSPILRSWSWDRADSFAEKLNVIVKKQQSSERGQSAN
jgi:hypothetical protein